MALVWANFTWTLIFILGIYRAINSLDKELLPLVRLNGQIIGNASRFRKNMHFGPIFDQAFSITEMTA